MNFPIYKTLIIACLLTLVSTLSQAQNKKVIRAEIETTEDARPFNIVNLGKNGILIITRLNEFLDRKTQNWTFTFYNHHLQKKWTQKLPFSEDLDYQGFGFEKDTAYLFFYKDNKRSSENNLKIVAFELTKGKFTNYDTIVSDKANLTTLQIYLQNAYFTIENKENIKLYIKNLTNNTLTEIVVDNTDNTNIENLTIDSIQNVMYLLIKKEISKRENILILKKYDLTGKELSTMEIKNPDDKLKLLTGMVSLLKNDSIIITGSYNLSDEKSSNYAETSILEAAGVYFVRIDANVVKPFRFINFLTFDNIHKYLNKREVSKIKKIQESKTQKEFSLNYLLIEHDVMQVDDKLILVAEAFYPEYRVISDMSYDYYGRMTPTSRTIFDGYRYTNAFVLCLDENGNTKWNQLFDIWNILTMEIKERVSVMPLKNELLMSYNDDGEIVYKIMNDTTTVSDIDNLKIEMNYANDKAMFNPSANIDYWYDHYYLVYGIQTIKNNSLANRSKRTVFYMNKVSFE